MSKYDDVVIAPVDNARNRTGSRMSSYIDDTLIEHERVIYKTRISKWSLLPLALTGLVFLPLFGVGIVFWIWATVIFSTTELAITNKRVIAKKGLIRRETVEMLLSKVESIHVTQSILGRMLDYGTVIISGTGTHSAPFRSIRAPLQFRKNFMIAADAAGKE